MVVIPAKAGRSAKRGERPKDGPEGVSEAHHPFALMPKAKMDSRFRGNDGRVLRQLARQRLATVFPRHASTPRYPPSQL